MSTAPKTLFEKVWQQHVVVEPEGEPTLLYIDLHLLHEVTSPQAFEGLRLAGRKVRRPDRSIATVDHNVPTTIEGRLNILDQIAATQIATLRNNCADFGVELYDVDSREQGIVHVIGPELGITKPGMTIVCGDSHTSTHGAFGALAFGIGTSEVEHVLATQTLPQDKPKTFRIAVEGQLPTGVTAKDIILAIIGQIGTDGATGCVIEYAGSAIRALSVEGRMTVCNMSIEAGARAGTKLEEVAIDRVFIGSCTNSRIEDLRAAARIASGYKVSTEVSAMVVPGSQAVKAQAEQEGLDKVFIEAGFDWREPGCSMCLGMNPDILSPGERCASTSNRNFEGRQGRGGRTHLVSPEMAAAAAIAGHFVDIRNWHVHQQVIA